MIRCIAALDSKKGIADDEGIPWQGSLPTDVAYYRKQVRHHKYLIGFGTYILQSVPLPQTEVIVAANASKQIRPGFKRVVDARQYLVSETDDVWVGGGAGLFASIMDLADELYLTRIAQDFHCTKFFPDFEDSYDMTSQTAAQTENGITFHFEIWKRRQLT